MPARNVPGFGSSKGIEAPKPLEPGDYVLECTKAEYKESQRSAGGSYVFSCSVLEGPEQEDGRSPEGRKYTDRIFIMNEDHASFAEYGYIGVNQLKDLSNAAGYKPKGDGFDEQKIVGRVFGAKLKVVSSTFTDKNTGKEEIREQNEVSKYFEVDADSINE